MRRFLLRLWLVGSALSATLLVGCSLNERTAYVRGLFSPSDLRPVAVVEEEEDLPGGVVPASYRLRPAIAALDVPIPARPRAPVVMRREKVTIVRVCKVEWQGAGPPAPIELARLEMPAPRCEPAQLARPVRYAASSLGRPRPFPTAAATPFAHAADHSWLVGYLHHAPAGGPWFIHYAVPEQEAPGGSLVLVNPGPMKGFRSGQLVRVEGHLVDPAPYEIEPAYAVRVIQALQP